MYWIAVHEKVQGSKLRGFRKRLGCSEAEALGILTLLWLWARKNADITGLLGNADRDDVAAAIKNSLSDTLDADVVTDALVSEGWIDEIDGQLFVHDWSEWQKYWYNYLDKKERDRARKRRAKDQQDEQTVAEMPEAPKELEEHKPEDEPPKPAKKPPKVKFAEKVSMRQEEYDKLVEQYGAAFTEKLVFELNNYKLATGKTYKDDYRAILNWVVDRCEKKYPNLKEARTKKAPAGTNPFAEYV